MAISAAMVKALRDKTGAGMMDCKKALVESGGDEEKAIVFLREKGLAKAAKKAGRATSEGLVVVRIADDGKSASIVELKCETDFVAKNEDFKAFAEQLAETALGMAATDGLQDLPEEAGNITDLIAKLGENMALGRYAKVEADGVIGAYVHSNSKLAALVMLNGSDDEAIAKDVAMQVAAVAPACVSPDQLPQDVLEKEKGIYLKQAMDEGKPENIAEKIVIGRLNKFYKEVCLMEQPFIKDDKKSIKNIIGDAEIKGFIRLALGDNAE